MRRDSLLILLVGLVVGVPGATLCAAPDETDLALLDAEMYDVLEARLVQQLRAVSTEEERLDTVERLADVYTRMLNQLEEGTPERRAVADRAWAFIDAAAVKEATELRLTLLIDAYVEIERAVALLEIGLLSPEDRGRHALRLAEVHARFKAIAGSVGSTRAGRNASDPEVLRRVERAIRVRSLANYYSGWSGLMLSILEDNRPSNEVVRHFGWLLGADGGPPMLDDVRDGTLSLDHVARAAIGVAWAEFRSGDSVIATMWLGKVIGSGSASAQVKQQAVQRKLRFFAEEGEWDALLPAIYEAYGTGDRREPLSTQEARYFALHSLAAGDNPGAMLVAEVALGDLIERGEIGHVLDLRDRFGSLPLLRDGFVSRYVDAIERLTAAEDAASPVRYLDAAGAFESAVGSKDASDFPIQRDDAALKRVFCLVRGEKPREALAAADAFIASDPDREGAEEAKWLRIVALEQLTDEKSEQQLLDAVVAYLRDYQGTHRARTLLVRYASAGVLDREETVRRLDEIPEGDRVRYEANTVLIRMLYRDWVAGGRRNAEQRTRIIDTAEWLWANPPAKRSARSAAGDMDVARIAIDASMSAEPVLSELAGRALGRADDAIRRDPTLSHLEPDLTLRRIEWLVIEGRLGEASTLAEGMRTAASELADSADKALLSGALDRLIDAPDDTAARTIVLTVGVRVADTLIPASPEQIGPQASAVVSRVIGVIATEETDDPTRDAIAMRLGRVLLERGSPTGQAVRELAAISERLGNAEVELLAWSVLLAASSSDEEAWWEARYHTLRLLTESDPAKAAEIYDQHKALYPLPGLLPWTRMIDELFGGMHNGASSGTSSGGGDE